MTRRQQIALLVILLIIGSAVWAYEYWPSTANGNANSSTFLRGYQPLNFPDSELHWRVVDHRRKAEYKGSGVNPFSMIIPPSPAEVKKANDEAQKLADAQRVAATNTPPPPPELPPNMKFFGYGSVPNGTTRRAFLSYQDDVYIVSEGDMLMGRYRIVKINNSNLEFEEVSSGRHGQKALEDQGPTA